MDEGTTLLAVSIAVLVVAGGFVLFGPVGGDTTADRDGDQATAPSPATADAESDLVFSIEEIDDCGTTCRDVTASLVNDGNETAEEVVVETTIYTDGDVIWTGNETVGTIKAGDTHTTTQRVDISTFDAAKIKRNDGWITVETVVETTDGTDRFVERRQVA